MTNENMVVVYESRKWAGIEVADNFKEAYDTEAQQKGVVDGAGQFFPTVPLNGHRARNLAEEVLGEREAGLWTIDKAIIVDAKTIQELPGFDSTNQAVVDSFEGKVMIHVVVYDPGYGQHIRILQA